MLQRSKPYILLFPALAVIVILFFGGLISGFLQSIGFWDIGRESNFTFNAYRVLLTSPDFLKSLLITLKISIVSAIVSGIISLFLINIFFIIEENKCLKFIKNILYMPMLIPHITAAYLIGLLFMKSGWLSSITYYLGITNSIDSFPSIINDANCFGIIITYMWKEIPFIMLMLVPVVHRVEISWLETANIYGASRKEFFKEILLSLLIPSWIFSMLIVFAFIFSDFDVPYLLGVTYPKFISVYAYDIYFNGDLALRPLALAANFITVLITAFAGIAAYKISKKWDIQKEMRW